MANVGVIKSSWISAAPGSRLDAGFWLAVREGMAELGIDPDTAGTAEVKRTIEHLDQKKAATLKEAADTQAEANALEAKARGLRQQAEKIRPK